MSISDIIALLSTLATVAMAVSAFVTIRQNNKQLVELKQQWVEQQRQWQEQNRPRLMPCFVLYNGRSDVQGYLRIKNISNTPAFGVSVEISSQDEVTENGSDVTYKELVETLQKTSFQLEPHGVKDFGFIVTRWPEAKYQGKVNVHINYSDVYSEDFTLYMSEFDILSDSLSNENSIAHSINKLTGSVEDISDSMSRLSR